MRIRPLRLTAWLLVLLVVALGAAVEIAPRALSRADAGGLRATWTGGPLHAVRPAIDHVLTGGEWRPAGSGVLPIAGSDHRAVWTRVVRAED